MSSLAQKIPLVESFNRFFEGKISDWSQLIGKAWPASVNAVDPTNTIVTLKFEINTSLNLPANIQCPIGFPQYVRWPIQVGDFGFVVSVGAYMGGMSGIGGGTATLQQMPNLSTLVWFPCGNKNFQQTEDPKKVILYGPNGGKLRTQDGVGLVEVDENETWVRAQYGPALWTLTEALGLFVENNSPNTPNALIGAKLVQATNNTTARAAGVPLWGFYRLPGDPAGVAIRTA